MGYNKPNNMKTHISNPARLTAIFIFPLVCISITQAKAQFPGGFFNQQATKKKLMAEQLAGYQLPECDQNRLLDCQ